MAKKKKKSFQGEYSTRIVSTVHAIIVFYFACFALFTNENDVWNNPVYGRTKHTQNAMAFAAAYFVVDFTIVISYWIEPVPPIAVHHILAGWGFLAGFSAIGRFSLWAALLLLTEGSNPFNNLVWYLEAHGYKGTRVWHVAFNLFALSWLICRIMVWPVIFYQLYVHRVAFLSTNVYMIYIIGANFVFLFLLNYVFFFTNTGPFLNYYFGKNKKKNTAKKNKKKN